MATPQTNTDKNTFKGSCHCKRITYTATLTSDLLASSTAGRCNCTICLKQGFTGVRLPKDSFNLLTPASLSECNDYRMNPAHDIHKYFCGTCGVHVASEGKFEWEGQMIEFFQISVVTLEQPQDGLDLSEWKVRYVDGRNDRFMEVGEKPFPGGMI